MSQLKMACPASLVAENGRIGVGKARSGVSAWPHGSTNHRRTVGGLALGLRTKSFSAASPTPGAPGPPKALQ
jgi:hypothetical protein